MLSVEDKKKIVDILAQRGVGTLPCPMCHSKDFMLVDSYTTIQLQDNLKEIRIGGSNIPTIAIVCKNCGFISQHALGVLGLLPDEKEVNNK